jgi:hypothetical protein
MNLETLKLQIDRFKSGEASRILAFKDVLEPRVNKAIIDELIEQGFCDMPASVKHHGAYTGALFDHSYAVASILELFTDNLDLKWSRDTSPIVVGMLHDLCKIDKYKQVVTLGPGTQVLNDGKVIAEKVGDIRGTSWDYNPNPFPIKGHGAKSVMLAQKCVNLTDEEMLCIYHHMGAYEKDDWAEFDQAIKLYPNVLWTHQADMIASKILGV